MKAMRIRAADMEVILEGHVYYWEGSDDETRAGLLVRSVGKSC
jgi:hypothetical protein